MPPSDRYRPDPRFPTLGDGFADVVPAARFPRHVRRFRNDRAAATTGLDTLDDAEWERAFARFEPLPGNLAAPLALRYHGHQFQHYNPYLGDGRGFLYAQLRDDRGRLLDLGTKGSGTTPWSRGGDGRLTLKGGVRELLATEMLEALGVDTSKTFSLFETGESLDRHDEPSPTRASVLVRLSHSHLRIGTFQRLATIGDAAGLRKLVDYAIAHYHPAAKGPRDLLAAASDALGDTCGRWMAAGFVHGVLNTDNLNVTGESFDYGPWRFAPTADPELTAAYFDGEGLYAYGRQPTAVRWGLEQLGRALTPLGERLDGALDGYPAALFGGLRAGVLRRLGLRSAGDAADTALVDAWTRWLEATRVPMHQAYFDWFGGDAARAARSPLAAAYEAPGFAPVRATLDAFTPVGGPAPDAPVDMLIGTVEALWDAIDLTDDWAPLHRHVAAVRALGERLSVEPAAG